MSWILSAAQESDSTEQESKSKEQKSKTKVQESKTRYKESKILLEDSKYWQINIVSLTLWAIYQKVSKGIFLLRIHFPLLENVNPFQSVPGYNPGHTLGTSGQEPHRPPPKKTPNGACTSTEGEKAHPLMMAIMECDPWMPLVQVCL
ncbi:hypothetical protein DSO57_1037467 [Entomophthora muscae]|uniref:Uncharacterized protein n=1 Tax=Entomophthora muscae TaxID=34485 RepID=A0ACC2TLD7_9FUNG|nr:hypothetical protein DSO57_1037467 [Entomophthora muscae]